MIERWEQIDQLFHSALDREAGERAAFLAQACKGDESLRQELESLIGSHEQSESFIEKPAGDIAAELLSARFDAEPEMNPLSNNQKLQWARDGRSVYYIALTNGVSNIWRQPVDGSPPAQVTQFTTGHIFNFAYSSDGEQLALSRGSLDSDVVLIKNLD